MNDGAPFKSYIPKIPWFSHSLKPLSVGDRGQSTGAYSLLELFKSSDDAVEDHSLRLTCTQLSLKYPHRGYRNEFRVYKKSIKDLKASCGKFSCGIKTVIN